MLWEAIYNRRGVFFDLFFVFWWAFFSSPAFQISIIHGVLGAIVALDVDAVCSIFFGRQSGLSVHDMFFFDGFCACMLQQHSFLFVCIFSGLSCVFGRRGQFGLDADNRYDSQWTASQHGVLLQMQAKIEEAL